MAYTYDPSQSIKQGFQQAQSGVGDIFTHIIAQQQRDYSLAENTLNNVEALKKNIGIWGTKEITDGANNLLGQVSSAINKNGNLDYSKLGQVRQEISNLADLKTGYDVFGKQFDRLVQIGAANKENLTSFESFYKNLVSLAANKKLIANPNDLATAMNNVLDDHINTAKMGVTAIKNNLAVTPIVGMYVDPKTKLEVTYNANVFDGVTVGADGKLVKPTDPVFYQGLAAKIKASDPAAFDAQRKKLSKIGQADIPDAEIVKSWFDSMPAGEMKPVSVKTDRQVKGEEAQTGAAVFKVSHQQQEFNTDMLTKNAGITQSRASARNLNSNADKTDMEIGILKGQGNADVLSTYPTEASVTTVDKNNKPSTRKIAAIGAPLGKAILLTVPTNKGDMSLNITDVTRDKDGTIRVVYLQPAPKSSSNPLQMTVDDIKNPVPSSAIVKYATIDPKQEERFKSTMRQGIISNITDKAEGANTWRRVNSIFSPIKPSESKSSSSATKVAPSGMYISASALKAMYGKDKPYKNEQEAANAAINLYGHTVEGYSN